MSGYVWTGPERFKDNLSIPRSNLYGESQIIYSRRKLIYTVTSSVAKLKEMKRPRESTETLTSRFNLK